MRLRLVMVVLALALGAWFLRNRRRREQLRDATAEMSAGLQAQQDRATETLRNVGATVRDRVDEARSQAAGTVGEVATAAAEKGQEIANTARQAASEAPAGVQGAAGAVADRAEQASETAASEAQAATDTASAQADVGTPPPSVHDTVQAELSDVAEKVEGTREQVQAPAEPAKKSAGQAFGAGTMSSTDLKTASTEAATGQVEAREEGIAPEGQRPRPIAGEGTTTATGPADRRTSSGAAEPLPAGLEPGEPGTGGPSASAQAPSTPDNVETPTTGMEHAPEIDRADVLERTSGDFIGNRSTRVFHAATASNLPSEENRVYFETEEEALAAGFRPAANEGLDTAES